MRLIEQFDSADCGPACLSMISREYGARWSLTQVRSLAGSDRHGTNLNGLILASENMGFEAKALKSPDKVLDPAHPVPFIAHYDIKDGDHFVVVYKINNEFVWVADPAQGKLKLRHEAFRENWSGYAVFLTPTPEFKPNLEKKGLLSRFLPLFKPHWSIIVQAILSSIVLILLGIIGTFYFAYLVDEVLPSKSESALHILSLGVVLLTLFQTGLGTIRDHMLSHFSLKTSLALNFSYLKHVLRQPLWFFDSRKVGEILSRMNDGEKVRGILSSIFLSIFMDIMMMIVSGIVLLTRNPLLFVVAVAAVPLSTAILYGFAPYFREMYRKSMAESAESQSFLVESLNGMPTVKGLNASDRIFEEIESRVMKNTRTGYQTSIAGRIQGFLVGIINGWGGNVLIWVGSWMILKDEISLGSLLAFNALLGYFLGPLQRLLGLQTTIQEAMVAADRLGEVLELPEEIDRTKAYLKPSEVSGSFDIKDITFRYGSRRPVLENLNLRIEPGSRVAFVGPSGCGKSTLVKLLLKFYKAEVGDVFLDGKNLVDWDTEYLRSKMGYVPQEVFLFSGSIRENISIHRPEATFDEIMEAAEKAQAHEFINELPERYDTILAERGSSLSGGERQRLALARALLGKPNILIFDEATSNLDVITEKRIHETLNELARENITTILVAHRLSTVINCDQIIVMEKGKVVETGNHFELVKRGGAYAKLWEYQKL